MSSTQGRQDGSGGDRAEVEERGIELSPGDLSAEALRGLVEEFVSREGTDYGHVDRSLEGKVHDVMRQLETGEARIVFDLESETASIVSTREQRARG
ncbi:YheU family protein [Myxococcota bacterium]|nr:YheU family protein [Myxococcota bacterium]